MQKLVELFSFDDLRYQIIPGMKDTLMVFKIGLEPSRDWVPAAG